MDEFVQLRVCVTARLKVCASDQVVVCAFAGRVRAYLIDDLLDGWVLWTSYVPTVFKER